MSAPRWPTLIVLMISVAALGVAVGAWFRPLPDDKTVTSSKLSFTDQQVADAKASVCAAFDKAHQAVVIARARSGSTDPTAQLAVAEGGWQALETSSEYLRVKLVELPATRTDLVDAVNKLTDVYQELTVDYLANVSDSELQPLLHASDQITSTIERLCR